MAYQRNWSDHWTVGAEVYYFDRYDRDSRNPKLCKIVSISSKLGHATIDLKLHDGSPMKTKFRLSNGNWAQEIGAVGSYHANLRIRTAEYDKEQEERAALRKLKVRQGEAISRLNEVCRYGLLNEHCIEQLESIIAAHNALKSAE